MERPSLRGIGWLQLMWKGASAPAALGGSILKAQNIVLKFPKSKYEVKCGQLNLSLYDSEVMVNNLDIHPYVNDNQFFDESEFRKTRFRMVLPQLKVNGLTYLGYQKNKIYHADFIEIKDISLDVLVNKYKASKPDTSKIQIQNKVFASLKEMIPVDSLRILNMQIKYGEVYEAQPDSARESTSVYSGYSSRISDLHFNILENHIEFSSVALNSSDSTFSCNINKSSASGVNWLQLIRKGTLVPDAFISSVVDAKGVVLKLPKLEYELHCGRLHISLLDSEIVLNDMVAHPIQDGEDFFEESKFRRTRYGLVLPQVNISGMDCNGLLQRKIYNARFIQISNPSLDVLVNMYKPYQRVASKTPLTKHIIPSVKEILNIDSLSILNGRLKYAECYKKGSNPGFITFSDVNMLAKGLSNNNNQGDTLVIRSNAKFMGTTKTKMILSIPLTSPKFTLQYTGSMGNLELIKLNSFLEIAENYRIKSGKINSGSIMINVKDRRAKGYVRSDYQDFKLALIDEKTGSEKGIGNRLKSLYANIFKLNGSNKPDKAGILKLGNVNYLRKSDDTFIQFLWFSMRSGIGDIGGF
jgi:hypothetical protein